MISKLENYRHNLSLIGITIDEVLLLNLYQNLPTNVQIGAKVILLPIAAKEGVVYAMDNITGDLVPFNFSRSSSATLFDKDKNLELVGNNIPRIDYGNYMEGVKLLVEKESTNLVMDNTNILTGFVKDSEVIIEPFDWGNVINSSKAANIPYLTTGNTPYFYNIINQIQNMIYTYSVFCKTYYKYPIINASGYIRSDDGGFSSLNQTSISTGSAPNIQYRNDTGRFYSIKKANTSSSQFNGIAKSINSLGNSLYVGGAQIEKGDIMTSYIPTEGSPVTRSADLLSINIDKASTVYLKTTRQEATFQKDAGIWNIHEDLNNEGIEALAIFYEDIIIGFDEETAVEEFIIPIRDKNQVVKARYALKDTDIEKNTLMSEHYIELSFALDIFFKFVRSDYIIWEGEKYIIKEDYIPDEVNKCNYKYTLRFDHWTTLLQDDTFYYMNQNLEEAEWSLMSNAATHFQLLADNANRYFGVNSFNVGTIEFTELKYLRFDKVSIWDAATQIAEEYGGEWYLTGTTFHLVKKFSYGSEIDFESEVSVEKMERSEGENSEKYTRILALSSTRNVPNNYRVTTPGEAVDAIFQKRLRIPASKGKFIDAKPNMSPEEIKSAVVIFEKVYPKRIGTMSSISTVEYTDTDTDTGVVTKWNAYRYKDTGLQFKKEYEMPGVELRIAIQSGTTLNGLDFAVKFNPLGKPETDPDSQLFEIVRNEDYGKALPNDTLKPQNGDTYILYGFNIQLVSDQYIPAGEQELYDTAVEWQQDMLKDKSVFECPTMIQHFADNEMDLEIGQKVKLIHDQFEGGFRSSRIQGYEKRLLNKYQATYTVGDNAAASWAKSVDNSIKELQIAGVTYQATGKNGVYLITQFDNTPASDFNAYSAKASDARYLNKQTGGTVQGDVLFQKKIKAKEAVSDKFGNETFMPGMLGNGFRFWIENGLSFGQIDYLTITREMLISVLTVAEVKSVDGGILISSANMVCSSVEDITTGYKCYFDNDEGNIPNKFVVGDQAMCRRFNGANVKYYWRLVTEVGTDYILLSKTDKDGSGIPEAKDNIVQFGNRTDTQRQFAIYSVAYGDAGTFYYYGVNSYDLTGKAKTYFSKSGARIEGDSIVFSSSGKSAATAISEVDTKASNAQTSANTANAGLLSKVAYSEYNAQMQVLNTQISSKVAQTDFNSLDGRVASTESSITQQAGQISSVVEKVNVLDQKGINRFIRIGWISGGWSPIIGSVLIAQTKSTRIRPNTDAFLAALSNALYSFKNDNSTYQAVIYELDKNKKLIKNHGWVDGNYQFTTLSTTAYFAFLGRKRTDANISASDIWSFTCKLEQGDFTDYSVAPEDMSYLVNNAQATADSKTRTYYQDAQPTAPSGGFSVGDIWQKVTYTDTSGVVNMDSSKNVCRFEYRWNGTTWVQINFNVSGSYVTQTNDSISSLVTKTGINSLGTGETLKSLIDQTPDKITLAVSAIQIGGRNLIPNTNQGITGWAATVQTGTVTYTEVQQQGVRAVKATTSGFTSGYHVLRKNINRSLLQNQKQYTLSLDLFCEFSTTASFLILAANGTNQLINFGSKAITANTWVHIELTATSTTNTGTDQYLYITGFNQNASVTFANIKIEEGNKATAWSPSLEDTQSQIDGKTTLAEVASSLSIAANKITLSSKTIELKGDTIADAIEAGQLNVGNGKFKVDPNGDFTSKNANIEGALRVSGNNQITVADANGNTRVTIKPTDITSIANIGGNETVEYVNTGGAAASDSVTNQTKVWYGRTFTLPAGKVYDLVIPAITIGATVRAGSSDPTYARAVVRLINTITYVSYEISSIYASPSELGGTISQLVKLNGVVAGSWRIEIEIMATSDTQLPGTIASFTLNSNAVIQVIPLSQFTEMGLNGFLTAMSSNKYMHITTDGIYMRMEQYMLRLTSSGLQKSTNGGASWISI